MLKGINICCVTDNLGIKKLKIVSREPRNGMTSFLQI